MILTPLSRRRSLGSWFLPIAVMTAVLPVYASTPKTPEQETLAAAKQLKPIPDNEWEKIAGDRMSRKYQIVQGDTLYDISKRLFGDPKYWPKIWALNNGHILNPHLILPGRSISFTPGTGTVLPSVTVAEAEGESESDGETPLHAPRSQEWKKLPRQAWESVSIALPPQVDPLGFDERSRVKSAGATGFDLPVMITTHRVQPMGLIFASEKESNMISLQDLVFVHPEGDIQVGQIYSIVDEPNKLSSPATDRAGYIYPILGKVKIIQQTENNYIGLIINAQSPIERGAILIPLQPKIPLLTPIPGPNPIEGTVLVDPENSTTSTVQHKFVFIDRGSDDGVSQGMVFRVYQHMDPNNFKRETLTNALITADIMVLQVSSRMSTGLITSGYTFVTAGSTALLLTDISDLLKKKGPDQLRLDPSKILSPDELDSLDNGTGLMDSEKRELKQLEDWKTNLQPVPSPSPSSSPSPSPSPSPSASPSPLPSPSVAETPSPTPSEEPPPPPTAPSPEDEIAPTAPPEPQSAAPAAPPEAAPPVQEDVPAPPANEPAIENAPGGDLPPPPPPPPPASQ